MRTRALLLLVLATLSGTAFVAGRSLADIEDKQKQAGTIALLKKRQAKLYEDIKKIERAAKDWTEIQAMRKTGDFVLNKYELKMEKSGKQDFHIFMERFRNDTLDTLAILDRIVKKEAYVDPLRSVFGDKLAEIVEIEWVDMSIEDIADELVGNFRVKIGIQGEFEHQKSISFNGKMTVLAALLQLETLFDIDLRVEGDKLWLVVPDAKDGK